MSHKVGEDGFVHAADLSPDELEKLERQGSSGRSPTTGRDARHSPGGAG